MSNLDCRALKIKVDNPDGLAPGLFFQAYSGANPVAYAQLSARSEKTRQSDRRRSRSTGSAAPGVNYCLKLIEVSQHYRNQGIGSELLDGVIKFCKEERVNSIYGEARGEMEFLRKWYQDKGFDLDSADDIELHINR